MRRHSPLALPNPNEIVVIAAEPKGDETGDFQFSFSTEQMQDFQERAGSFSAVVGLMPRLGGLVADGKASKFWFAAVSDNYFTGLGVRPAAGTLFTGRSGSPVRRRERGAGRRRRADDDLADEYPESDQGIAAVVVPEPLARSLRIRAASGPSRSQQNPHSWTLEVPRTRDPQRQAAGRLKPAPPFTRAAVVGVRGHSASLRHRRTHASSPRRNRSGR